MKLGKGDMNDTFSSILGGSNILLLHIIHLEVIMCIGRKKEGPSLIKSFFQISNGFPYPSLMGCFDNHATAANK